MRHIKPDKAQVPYFILGVILVCGLFVRIRGLSAYAYNGDELQFILIAKGGTLAEVWKRGLIELHPPLLHFIRHYLLMITPDIFIQRLFSVAAGMIAVLGMYLLGLLLRGQAVGVFCALCMALATLAVSTSMLIRDYAFFMPLLIGAFYCFMRYQGQHKRGDLLGFASLIFLASAMNFSGFLVAAACGLYEGCRLLAARRWRVLLSFCASFLPLLVLGVFFYCNYMAPGTAGPMWERLAVVSGAAPGDFAGRLGSTWRSVFWFFVPFIGFPAVAPAWMLLGGFWLILLQAAGLCRMYTEARDLCCFILVLWGVAVIASLVNIYPFLPTRHSCYLLPFFILPFGYLLEPLTRRILLSPALAFCTSLCIALAALFLGTSNGYLNFTGEFALEQKDLDSGQEYLAAHLKPGDAIVTGKGTAYSYLFDTEYNGRMAYNSYADFPYLHDTLVLAPFDPPLRPYADWHPFHDDLQSRIEAHVVPPKGKFWFVVYGWKSAEIWHLMECSAVQRQIGNFFSRPGVLIFSIRETALAAFVRNNNAFGQCFADYKPLLVGVPFHEVREPL